MLTAMTTTDDQIAVRDALLRGEITWEQALEAITSRRGKPWHTAAWKQKRDLLIGDRCEQCGSEKAPLVLQHLWQPHRYSEIYEAVYTDLFRSEYKKWQAELEIVEDRYPPVDRPACPKCQSTAVRALANGTWVCNSTANSPTKWPSNMIRCGFQFEQPVIVKAHSPDQKRAIVADKNARYERFRQDFRQRFHDSVSTRAVLLSIDEHLRYVSFTDTKTFCKKCAFMWDKRECKLCEVCRERFHSRHLSRCARCDPEHYKLCRKCGHQYHASSFQQCYACYTGKPGAYNRSEGLLAVVPPEEI